MNWLEVVAVVFGLACVALTVRQNVWCWPTGLVQVALYVFIFYQARLYSDLLLHIFYIGLQIYGWYHWTRGRRNEAALPVSTLTRRMLLLACLGAVAGAIGWGGAMAHCTDAAAPYADAFVASASLVAQYLLARKKLENWYFWIVVDVVAIAVYWSRELRLTAGLYAVFLGLCIAGLVAWRRSPTLSAGPAVVGSEA
jgi:nicotinamide mononucleotide transporter